MNKIAYISACFLLLVTILPVESQITVTPENHVAPEELKDFKTMDDNTCMRKAWEEYQLVLEDSRNRADHFYLASTYRAMGEANLICE